MSKARKTYNSVGRLETAAGKVARLTARQQKALALIMTGSALVDVARKVGVTRGTVYNWIHRHERFMAALESWHRDMEKTARSRLMGLSGLGVKSIAVAMEQGDAKVALAMFKGLGVFEGKKEEKEEGVKVVYRREVKRVEGGAQSGLDSIVGD